MDEKPKPSKKVRAAGKRCRRIARDVLALDAALPKLDWGAPADLCPALMFRSPVFCGSVLVSLMESSYVHAPYACQYESKVTAAAHLYCASRLAGRPDLWTAAVPSRKHKTALASLHGWKCFRNAGIPVPDATVGT